MEKKELGSFIDEILGFIWPPFGWYLKQRKFDAMEREQYAKWYKEVYMPWKKQESIRLLIEAEQPTFVKQFIRTV